MTTFGWTLNLPDSKVWAPKHYMVQRERILSKKHSGWKESHGERDWGGKVMDLDGEQKSLEKLEHGK